MTGRALRVLVPGLLLPAFMTHAGGWAVITVDDLPDYAVAGRPLQLTFTVRQHGVTPLEKLRASVSAASGRTQSTGTVRPGTVRGQYVASLMLPRTGNWAITIRSGFGNSDVTLPPIPAVDAAVAAVPVSMSDTERGQRLFVAKGCVTCHQVVRVGPSLDGRRFEAGYLAGFLANPKRPTPTPGQPAMPNLGLRQREIASLVAFLNSDRQVGSR